MKYLKLLQRIGLFNFSKKIIFKSLRRLIIITSYFRDCYILIGREKLRSVSFFKIKDEVFINFLDDYKYTADMYINNKCILLGYGVFNISDENGKIEINKDFVNETDFSYLSNVYYKNIVLNGVGDIKVPWEVGRFKEFISLSVCAVFFNDNIYFDKIKSAMDVFEKNAKFPFGIHWACPMEVSIRMVNLIVSYSILRKFFQDNELEFLKNSINVHYMYLNNNDEFNFGLRNNHYFCCINALLIGAYFFNDDRKFKKIERKIITEFNYQFNNDGSNFEASTCYHRYSLEMVAWSTLLTYQKFDFHEIKDLFLKALNFIISITNNIDNNIPIIGDNDSGFFLRLHPLFLDKKPYSLNSNYILNFIYPQNIADAIFIKNSKFYKDNVKFFSSIKDMRNVLKIEEKRPLVKGFNKISKKEYKFKIGNGGNFNYFLFSDFGLFVVKNKTFYCSFRFGGRSCGHMHNDALSIELWVDNKCIIRDPGTYVYTSSKYDRNLYRSYRSHFSPQTYSSEQNRLTDSLFSIGNNISDHIKIWNGYVYSYLEDENDRLYRFLKINKNVVEILDISLKNDLVDISFDDINQLFCLDYGKK
ncbi:heparinase II/III domain-containing protein [Photobacterium leiognathi]|uniref:heparinase II/III domain-containing protein n=1 Tax=Photobacterium leiognathi TaxID=553611 RepID=UPI002980F483|nr:heparinase II/III family protein [Photobacterium leiognathi]